MIQIHLRLQKRIQRPEGYHIKVRDVAELIAPSEVITQLNEIPIRKLKSNQNDILVIEIFEVIKQIKQQFPHAQIQYYGELETIIDVHVQPPTTNWVFILFAWLLLFFGAGLAIMDFHSDVGMAKVHRTLYKLLTGKTEQYPLWMQIPYSFGLGLGMILFFNRWFKKKVNNEPNPLDIEMQTYQDDLNKSIIATHANNKHAAEVIRK